MYTSIILTLTLLLSTTFAAPIPQDTTCVASTLNPGSCDDGSGNVNLDAPVDVSPTVDLARILVREPVAEPEAAAEADPDVCVASTLNPGSCDEGSGNVNVDAPVTVDPTVSL